MHHYRVTLNGPDGAVARLARELIDRGAVAGGGGADEFVWCMSDGPASVEALSRRHPRVRVGMECFEALGDELLCAVVEGGSSTVLERRALSLDADGPVQQAWGICIDEDGEVLDEARVRSAAAVVAVTEVDGGSLHDGAASALALGAAFGRLCDVASAHARCEQPTARTLAALRELASLACTVGAARSSMSLAELEFERAWLLTQARVHAASEPLWDEPGRASWHEWLEHLTTSAFAAIAAGFLCAPAAMTEDDAVAEEHVRSPGERLEASAGSLVSTCLQALVLFEEEPSDRAERAA